MGLCGKEALALPTELPVRTRSSLASEFELIALASLLPWGLSLLLASHDPAMAHALVLAGQFG
jgi:hypothetical protein